MKLVTALLFACTGLFLGTKSEHTNPVVAWSFDKTNGSTLIPDFTSDERFFADLKSLEEVEPLRPGVVGNGIFLSGTTLKLANSLTTEDCLFDSESCLGLHLSFWIKIERWNSDNEQSLLKTMTSSKTLPGIFFGKGDNTHLLVYIRGSEGKTYETTLPSTYLWDRWGHLDIRWNKANQSITIHLNHTYITEETIIGKAGTDPRSDVAVTNLVLGGSSGPTFLMDELEVYYQCDNNVTGEHHTTQAHTTHRPTWIAPTTTENLMSMPFSTAATVSSGATQTQSPVTSTTSPAKSNLVFYIFATIIVLVLVSVVAIWYRRRRLRRIRRRDEPDGVRLFDIDRERFEPYRDSDTDLTDS